MGRVLQARVGHFTSLSRDELAGFRRNNYSIHKAGSLSVRCVSHLFAGAYSIQAGSNELASPGLLAFIPSSSCHALGEEFVEAVVEVLLEAITAGGNHREAMDTLYREACNHSTGGNMETEASIPATSEIIPTASTSPTYPDTPPHVTSSKPSFNSSFNSTTELDKDIKSATKFINFELIPVCAVAAVVVLSLILLLLLVHTCRPFHRSHSTQVSPPRLHIVSEEMFYKNIARTNPHNYEPFVKAD